MGEIIHVNFGGNNAPEDKGKEPVAVSDKAETVARNFSAALEKISKIQDFLASVGISNSTLATVSTEVQQMEMKDVLDTIAGSSEQDWRLKPMYYRALTDRVTDPSSLADAFAAMISAFGDKKD